MDSVPRFWPLMEVNSQVSQKNQAWAGILDFCDKVEIHKYVY